MKRALPLLFVLLCSTALAESGAYQVEVIVFRNLAVAAEPAPVDELRSFSRFPSLLEPVLEVPLEVGLMEAVTDPQQGDPEPMEESEPIMLRADLPDDLVAVDEKSPALDDAWRRLRGSRDYRPLLYAGWRQNRVDYYPPVRVHDLEVIDTRLQIPANISFATPAVADPALADPAVTGLTAEDPIVVEPTDIDPMAVDPVASDPTAANLMAAYRVNFYRLDGSVQLRRSRFLHLYLDIEYRETGPWTGPDPMTPDGIIDVQPDEASSPYTVFALQQNRQVRTGRMQYFDTPQFGVLVLVTAIAPEEATPADEQ